MNAGAASRSIDRDRIGDLLADLHDWVRRRSAIGPRSRRARGFAHFGAGSIICFPPAALFGEQSIHIGSDVLIGPNVSLSAGMSPGQPLIGDRIVVLGDRCVVGRNSSISGHLGIEIGDDVYFGPNVYVTDQNHTGADPTLPIGRQAAPERPVKIGAGSWIGTNAVILPGVTIGAGAIIGAGAVVTRDVPAGAVAVGSPARVVSGSAPRFRAGMEMNALPADGGALRVGDGEGVAFLGITAVEPDLEPPDPLLG